MRSSFHDTASAAAFSDDKLNKVSLFESPHMFCDVYCLLPGQFQKPHSHEGSDKIYHVLQGTASIQLGHETREVHAGQLAVAASGVEHGVVNNSAAPTTLLVVMGPHPAFKG
ncbi:MAG: quercetin dioxygenase-like cupin family protein [Pseudohongiellaceae bacterium]|jgi:quercetin dioxygenase-like cupin family protein